ncbi:MAG: archaeal proteasome endopeptidase complex subunit alpha [Candidatus Pacearchaeota archaeon]
MEIQGDMHNQIMGYDRTSTMFSPDGHLLQVEYAEKTVRLGSASIGMICKDGVLIVSDKRIKDKLIADNSASKIYEIDTNIMATAAGILSDARVLIERARLIAQQNRVTYNESIEVESVMREIANIKQAYSQYGGARPFGVSIMIAGISKSKGKIFVSDVTGNYLSYKATAIGENDEKIKEELRKEYNENLKIEDGIKIALKIFKKVLEKNFDISRIEAAYIKLDEKKIKRLKEEELKKLVKI